MKRIILHCEYTNEPVYITIKAIDAVEVGYNVHAERGKETDCSTIYIGKWRFLVKETFDAVIAMIQKAESEGET